ncbi:MAG: hypothetical protein WCC00_10980, partial [Candidatus Aminicenantales bacterium]
MRTVLLVIFYIILVLSITPFIVFCMLTGLRQPLVEVGLWAMRVSRRILGIRIEAYGLEWIRKGTP